MFVRFCKMRVSNDVERSGDAKLSDTFQRFCLKYVRVSQTGHFLPTSTFFSGRQTYPCLNNVACSFKLTKLMRVRSDIGFRYYTSTWINWFYYEKSLISVNLSSLMLMLNQHGNAGVRHDFMYANRSLKFVPLWILLFNPSVENRANNSRGSTCVWMAKGSFNSFYVPPSRTTRNARHTFRQMAIRYWEFCSGNINYKVNINFIHVSVSLNECVCVCVNA